MKKKKKKRGNLQESLVNEGALLVLENALVCGQERLARQFHKEAGLRGHEAEYHFSVLMVYVCRRKARPCVFVRACVSARVHVCVHVCVGAHDMQARCDEDSKKTAHRNRASARESRASERLQARKIKSESKGDQPRDREPSP